MARYEVQFRKSVNKDLAPIPKPDVQRIIAVIAALADDPRPQQSRKLSGSEKYRLRCGVYRVLYEIQDAVLIVCVVKNNQWRYVVQALACLRPLAWIRTAQPCDYSFGV